jgi:zinc protease
VKKHELKHVRTEHGISEYVLGNGLRVLYKRDVSAPVVAVCVTFHVGSRNETKGVTGSTHILEHLLFKDTDTFKKSTGNQITDYLEWFGAMINATTWLDRTNYFELLPKERMREALELEASRMRCSLFNDDDLKSEMTVVRNEFERSRNDPFEALDEAMWAAAFTKHPYRIPTIGTKEDIEASTAQRLREFYDTYYWPNNATLAVFGDAEFVDVERSVIEYFAPIPRSRGEIPPMLTIEPEQTKPRRVVVARSSGIEATTLAYKAPRGAHADFALLSVLASILTDGLSSRFQRRLVDTGLATSVSQFSHPLFDPGWISFTAHVTSQPQKVLDTMRAVIAEVREHGVTEDELLRAKERIRNDMASAQNGVFAEIRMVSEAVAAGDWRLFYEQVASLDTIELRHLEAAAQIYLVPEKETAGILRNT